MGEGHVSSSPLWTPSAERMASTRMQEFVERIGREHPEVTDSVSLHEWSVREPGAFWEQMWRYAGVIGEAGDVVFDPVDGSVQRGRFFPGASVSVAENLLTPKVGAADEALVALMRTASLVRPAIARRVAFGSTRGRFRREFAATSAWRSPLALDSQFFSMRPNRTERKIIVN